MTDLPEIPQELVSAAMFNLGEREGEAWLHGLPTTMHRYSREWDVRLESVALGGAMSCCIFCSSKIGRFVMKIPVDRDGGIRELRYLEESSSTGATPRLVASSIETGVFLMERIEPGSPAWPTQGVVDADQFLDLANRLLNPVMRPARADDFPHLRSIVEMRLDWARERFLDSRYAKARTPLERAADVALHLMDQGASSEVLLHGDLQPKNILRGDANRWYAIDPLPCVGDFHADAAFWAVMQVGSSSIDTRIGQLVRRSFLNQRVLEAWAFVFSVAEMRPYDVASAARMSAYLQSGAGRQWC